EEYSKAIALRRKVAASSELDALLGETALAELGLAGAPEQVQSDVRRPIGEVQKLLRSTLGAIRDREARLEGLRRVTVALAEQGEAGRARALAAQLHGRPDADQSEALAVVGLELLRAGKTDEADRACRDVLANFKVKKGKPEVRPAVVALAVALGKEAP